MNIKLLCIPSFLLKIIYYTSFTFRGSHILGKAINEFMKITKLFIAFVGFVSQISSNLGLQLIVVFILAKNVMLLSVVILNTINRQLKFNCTNM